MCLGVLGIRVTLPKLYVVYDPVKGMLCSGVGLCDIYGYFCGLMDDQQVNKEFPVLGVSQQCNSNG